MSSRSGRLRCNRQVRRGRAPRRAGRQRVAGRGARAGREKYWGCLPFSSSPPRITFTDDADTFFGCDFDLLVEAAGHAAARQYARRGLEKGTDVLVVSVGVFADGGFYRELWDLAEEKGRRILLASGAARELCVEWEGVPSESNPSTSADVPLSVIEAIRNLTSPVCLSV